ncbi:hypothetical protein LSAT2_008208 [Lamellibrachia satsuma]|nr:hypothetical protein LSAT2_008208 [Lamellibrachia satsuma]
MLGQLFLRVFLFQNFHQQSSWIPEAGLWLAKKVKATTRDHADDYSADSWRSDYHSSSHAERCDCTKLCGDSNLDKLR